MGSMFSVVESQLQQVNVLLETTLRDENPIVGSVADHLLRASGKRLRPTIVLLAGQFGDQSPEALTRLVTVATAVEMIHMATLIHDDIIDEAVLRRGLPAVRQRFSNSVAVLTGDFLFARAFQLFASSHSTDIVDIASRVVHVMCVGEIKQNLSQGRVASESEYWERIEAKTGYFLEMSCYLGAISAGSSPELREILTNYGHHIGLAYQVIDDWLDWMADPQKLGKAVGGDLAAGIFTLPVIYTLQHKEYSTELSTLLSHPEGNLSSIKMLLEDSGALSYAKEQAEWHVQQAMHYAHQLPDGMAKETLKELATFILARDF